MSAGPIDAHVHLFPPDFITRRAELLGADPWFGEAYASPKAKMATAEELIASMDAAGVARSIAVCWPWRDPELCRIHNDYLADCARRFPDRIAWMAGVVPQHATAVPEVRRAVSMGCCAIGELNADGQGFDWAHPNLLRNFLAHCTEIGLPVMIHTSDPVGHSYPGKGTATPERLLTTIAAWPDLRLICAHLGGGLPYYELNKQVRAQCANVAYDSAASTYLYDFAVFPALERIVGPEKLIFASDWPVLGQSRYLSRVRAAGLPDDQLRALLHDNAARIYGLTTESAS